MGLCCGMPIKAAVMVAPGQPLEIWDLDDPELEPGSALLRILARKHERLPFSRLIGGRYGLEEADQALAGVEALGVTKRSWSPSRAQRKAPAVAHSFPRSSGRRTPSPPAPAPRR